MKMQNGLYNFLFKGQFRGCRGFSGCQSTIFCPESFNPRSLSFCCRLESDNGSNFVLDAASAIGNIEDVLLKVETGKDSDLFSMSNILK